MPEVHVQKGEFLLENWRTHCETGNHVTFLVSDDDLEPFKLATINKGKQVGQRYSFFLVEIGPDEQPVVPATPPPVKPPKPETKEAKAAREAAEFHAKTGDLLAPPATSTPELAPGMVELPGGTMGVPFVAQPDGSMARTVPTDSGMLEEAANEHKHHGFPPGLAGLAVMWSEDPGFYQWLIENFPDEWNDAASEKSGSAMAKRVICTVCGIESRKELDTDKRAATVFNLQFREPYAAFLADPADIPSNDPDDAEAPF